MLAQVRLLGRIRAHGTLRGRNDPKSQFAMPNFSDRFGNMLNASIFFLKILSKAFIDEAEDPGQFFEEMSASCRIQFEASGRAVIRDCFYS